MQKDCIVYSGIRDTHLFFRLVSYLMQNMGSRFSIPAVGKALKSNENTVASYLNFCVTVIFASMYVTFLIL